MKPPTTAEETKSKQEKKEDLLAQKIKEEKQKLVKEPATNKAEEKKDDSKQTQKKETNNKTSKAYVVQVGAFKDKDKAENAAKKAKNMGYSVKIVEEDYFYKVRVIVNTNNIESELGKLRKVFGGAIIKQ